MHHLIDMLWFLLPCILGNSGGSSATTETTTQTTSGASSPVASKDSQAVGSGSIAVAGAGAKYLEAGATDQSGAQVGGVGGNLNASGGAVVNIGDPNADKTISDLADALAGLNQGTTGAVLPAGSSGTYVETPAGPISTQTLLLIAGAIVLCDPGLLHLRTQKQMTPITITIPAYVNASGVKISSCTGKYFLVTALDRSLPR